MLIQFTTRQTPEVLFANCGHGEIRRLEDCKKLKFISAGQGKKEEQAPFYFSNQIRKLIIGDILAVYRNEIGFVGIARVISLPMTITLAFLSGQKVNRQMFSQLSNMFNNSDDPGYAECLVEIEWLTDVNLKEEKEQGWCYGGLTPRYVIGELSQNKYDCLQNKLGINFRSLLDNSVRNFTTKKQTYFGNNVIPVDEDEGETFPEGREKYLLHKSKERNKELIRKAKELYFQNDTRMKCQICDFSFVERYGTIG